MPLLDSIDFPRTQIYFHEHVSDLETYPVSQISKDVLRLIILGISAITLKTTIYSTKSE